MNGLAVNGHEGVPRLHAGLVCPSFEHDALDVNVILVGHQLRREASQHQQHHKRCKEVGRRASSKHPETFTPRRTHQLVRLGLGERTEGQRSELKQTKRANAHAVASSQQSVAEFVNHQGDDEGHDAPTKGNDRVDAGHSDELAGRRWGGGGR